MAEEARITRPSHPEKEPQRVEAVPIVSAQQYRFLRFAIDVAASLGERERLIASRSPSLSRVLAALRLFEQLPPR